MFTGICWESIKERLCLFPKEFEPLTGEQVGTIGSLHLGDMLRLEILVH